MPFNFNKFYQTLSLPERRKVDSIQWDLILENKNGDSKFTALECRKEAIRIYKEEHKSDARRDISEDSVGERLSEPKVGNRLRRPKHRK